MSEDSKIERSKDRDKLSKMRQEVIQEIGQDAYDRSGIKEIHDQEEGILEVEEENENP